MSYNRTHILWAVIQPAVYTCVWRQAYDTVCSMRPWALLALQQNCDLLVLESPGFGVTGSEASYVRRLGQTRTAQ
jgi:hypothetical protein